MWIDRFFKSGLGGRRQETGRPAEGGYPFDDGVPKHYQAPPMPPGDWRPDTSGLSRPTSMADAMSKIMGGDTSGAPMGRGPVSEQQAASGAQCDDAAFTRGPESGDRSSQNGAPRDVDRVHAGFGGAAPTNIRSLDVPSGLNIPTGWNVPADDRDD